MIVANSRIVLTRTPDGWMAEWFGYQRAKIEELFGTAIIPTAYTAACGAETVRREIAAANQDCIVEIGGAK